MRRVLCLLVAFASPLMSSPPTAPLPQGDRTFPLYDGPAPGSEHWNWPERVIYHPKVDLEFLQNVTRPSLVYFAPNPKRASGTAVIVAPGGGGVNLTIRYEGTRVAQQLAEAGAAVFVLKYRLVAHPLDAELSLAYKQDENGVVTEGPQQGENVRQLAVADAFAAMAWVRHHAAEFGVDFHRVGFVGFSAGGYLACQVVDGPPETRPDFFAPIYGARELPARTDSPPVFLATASDDDYSVPRSIALFQAWRAANRPAELLIFQIGTHGFLVKGGGGDQVIDRLEDWMRSNHWLKPKG